MSGNARLSLLLGIVVVSTPLTGLAQSESSLDAQVEVGIGHLDDEAFRYGRYSGLVDDGWIPWLNFELRATPQWNSADAGYWIVQGRDLGLDTVFFQAEAGEYGNQALTLQYREIPHYFFEDGQTPFRSVDTSRWILPDNWQVTDATTQTMTSLAANLMPVEIDHQRQRLDLHYQKQLPAAWQFEAEYRREIKQGHRPLAAMIGSTGGNARSAILPSEVDFETDIMQLGLRHVGAKSTFGMSYYGSFFSNNENRLVWQNPFGQQVQWAAGVAYPDGQGQLAQEPDNSAHQLRLAGSYAFTPITHASLEVGYGKMFQNDDFLPYTINDTLGVPAPLTRDSLEGEIQTLSADLRLSTRPMTKMHLVARYRLDDRDNQTPRLLYRPVAGDSQDQVDALEGILNRPYSYRQQTATIDARYRATSRVRIETGYQIEHTERNYSEVNDNREYTVHLGTTLRILDNVNLNLGYRYSERRGDDYEGNRPLIQAHLPGTVAAEDFENHPLLRKYYLADRQRDRIQFRADWFASERLTLGLQTAYNRDDYLDDYFGLNQVTLSSYTVDLSYLVGDNFHIAGFFSVDHYAQEQSGRSFTAAPGQADDPARNWWVDTADRFTTANITAEYEQVQQRFAFLRGWGLQGDLDLGVELSDSRTRGDVDSETGSALNAAPLPDIESRLRYYRLYGSYAISQAGTLTVTFSRELYSSDDFRLDDVDPGTMQRVLSLGEESPDYAINWLGFSYRHRF
ncbi:MAG: MtrB/PioB family decaheme-associated outer membrane protein [Cellvibrionaceae bacterium]